MMSWLWMLAPLVLWVLIHLKTSRSDGDLIKKIHPYRRLMPMVMRSKAEAVVYFELELPAAPIRSRLEKTGVSLTALLVQAIGETLHRHPELNRFVSGPRLYQRKEVVLSFSVKRNRSDKGSKVSVVKEVIPQALSPAQAEALLSGRLKEERSDKQTAADKEFNLLLMIPTMLLDTVICLIMWLDKRNLAPSALTEPDGMFASAFIANLGSIGLDPVHHHLFEWGNCPLFLAVGKYVTKPVVVEGSIVAQECLPIKITFDERVNDGLNSRIALQTFEQILLQGLEAEG